jgi:sulfite reductase (NADPH) flavoprotein alpha-component
MSNFTSSESSTSKQILLSRLLKRQQLTKKDSRTYLLTLEFDTAVNFKSGDSFAIYPHNEENDVLDFCKILGLDPNHKLDLISVYDHLKTNVSLSKWTSKMSKLLFQDGKLPEELQNLSPATILKGLDISHDLALELISLLPPQLPRYYSIASSPAISDRHMDLLVGLNSFEVDGQIKFGVASSYLCQQAGIGEMIKGFVHQAPHFKIPDTSNPIVMIGPGTGVAPFRAFIQERIKKQQNSNWLFFGERNKDYDFYFDEEFLEFQDQGFLKLSLAFSRDQEEKIYVQHLLLQQKEEVYKWLKNGALIYVCGDAKNMARDVEAAFIQILMEYENLDDKAALLQLRQWRKDRIYNLDVY